MSVVSFAKYGFMNARQRISTLLVSLLLTTGLVLAQSTAKNLLLYEPDTTVYTVVEKQPGFPGGFDALKAFLLTNVHYPSEAQKAGVKGRVFVNFIVETDGKLTDIQLLRGLDYGCDEEAIRVIKAMPCWLPGGQSGRPLRVRYNLPILFGIDYPKVKVR